MMIVLLLKHKEGKEEESPVKFARVTLVCASTIIHVMNILVEL